MTIRILCGDVRTRLADLPDESVHCVVTSPPYWGLRNYGVEGQIGCELTAGEHIDIMTVIFREIRRVLRSDGTLWLNYGDCYASTPNGRSAANTKAAGNDDRTFRDKPIPTIGPIYDPEGGARGGGKRGENKGNNNQIPEGRVCAGGVLKPKDLVMMPARIALALQADGWWLRSDIIWQKPNPMPESVNDRPTSAYEHIFLLAKSERYYFDMEAVKEPMSEVSLKRLSQPNVFEQPGGPKDPGTGNRSHRKAINNQAERLVKHEKWKTRFEGWDEHDKTLGRNIRNVWTIPTSPFPEAHFATFPPALVEPCIKAATSERGCCANCGAPLSRVTERVGEWRAQHDRKGKHDGTIYRVNPGGGIAGNNTNRQTIERGWEPSCECGAPVVPCTVLDPFGGAGTVGLVADQLGRDAILIELNPAYVEIARKRIESDGGMFTKVEIDAQDITSSPMRDSQLSDRD